MSENNERETNQGANQSPDSMSNQTPETNVSSSVDDYTPEFIRPEEDNSYTSQSSSESRYNQGTVMTEVTPGSKKKGKKLKAGIFAAVIVGIIAIAVFLNVDKIKNAIALSSKSPEEYFQTVVKDEFKSLMDESKKSSSIANQTDYTKDFAFDIKTEVEFGSYLKQMLEAQGIAFNNINADFSVNKIADKVKIDGVLGIDDKDLLSMLVLSDVAAKEVFVKLPELSNAFLKSPIETYSTTEDLGISNDEIISMFSEFAKKHGDSVYEEVFVDYFNAMVDTIDEVELSKNDTLKVDDIKISSNKLTATISEENAYDMMIAILEKAKDDDRVADFVTLIAELSGETLDFDAQNLDTVIGELKAEKQKASKDNYFEFSIWVDSDQQIRGIEFHVPSTDSSEEVTLRYAHVKDGKKGAFEFVANDGKNDVISLDGNYTKGSKGYTGKAKLVVNATDSYSEGNTTYSFNVKFEDLNNENNGINGKLELSMDTYAGTTISVNMEGTKDSQSFVIGLNLSGMEIGNLKVTAAKKDIENFDMPASSEVIYDYESQLYDYLDTLDSQGFLNSLNEKLGVDVNSLLQNYFGVAY